MLVLGDATGGGARVLVGPMTSALSSHLLLPHFDHIMVVLAACDWYYTRQQRYSQAAESLLMITCQQVAVSTLLTFMHLHLT